mgnify:CR=1 FL=1
MPLARHILLILCTLGIASCSTLPKETEKGKIVKIIKSPFAETCIQLGTFKYEGTPFIHEKELTLIMKELTAQLKGNAMRYDQFTPGVTGVSNAKGRGTAYRCHKRKLKKYLMGQEDKEFTDDSSDDPEYPEYKATKDDKESKEPRDRRN